MLTAARIIDQATQIAKVPGFRTQALDLLNSLQADLCESYDFAIARGLFEFDFNPGLASMFGSGPYNLPVDYLRASGSSGEGQKAFWWTLQGVPYPMIPCDLSEFDMQVQQAGLQSYPWLWATDMSNASLATSSRYKAAFASTMVAGDLVIAAPDISSIAAGDGIGGEGITPGTMITAVDGVTLNTTGDTLITNINNIGDLTGVVEGQYVTGGGGIPDNTVVTAILSSTSVAISQTATVIGTAVPIRFYGGALTLSQEATATLTEASVFTGVPPQAYAYPPPSGAYPVTIRYQRMMPPLLDTNRMPWFPNEGYLIEELAGRLMEITDDARISTFMGTGQTPGLAEKRLQKFLSNLDDKRNRPQTVELDRRRFGPNMRVLPHTKKIGW